jgi:hypothetical protein
MPPAGAQVKTGEAIDVWISDLRREGNF